MTCWWSPSAQLRCSATFIHGRIDIMEQGKKSVNMTKLGVTLMDPVVLLMLQIVLIIKMAQTICNYKDDNDDYFYSQFVAIRSLSNGAGFNSM
ncbi:hypothetical protein BC940DRAFT_333934 [Gongronella butleri]|nr:hypothetical protein BC940DRAFT_333934 [Gongronella butleri]